MVGSNSVNSNMAFRGIAMTQNGVPYNKKKSGTITGGIIGGLSALSCGSTLYAKSLLSKPDAANSVAESVKDIYQGKSNNEIIADLQQKYKKSAIITGAIAALSLTAGILIDKYRNDKAKAEAEQLAAQYQQYQQQQFIA